MQKKFYILVGLLWLTLPSWSQFQGEYYNYDWNVTNIDYDPVKHEVPAGIKETQYTVMRKGKEVKSVKEYNKNGQVTKLYPIDDPNQKRTTCELTYDSNQHLIKQTISKKRENKLTYLQSKLPNGKILTSEKIKYGKTEYKLVHTYNADGNPVETVRYGKGGKKMASRVTIEYHDKFNKSKTTLYNGKGKVKKVWLYDCKEEGELQTAKKHENRLCIRKDISDNVLTEVYQSFNAKGRAEKTVYKYHASDTSIFESTRYDSKDRLTARWTYNGSPDQTLEYSSYKKGKISYQEKYVYENGKLVSKSYLDKGKQISKATYFYNKDGYMTNNTWYGKKEKPSVSVMIEYKM